MSGPEAALACCRFLHDAASVLLWGAFGYLAALVPRDLRGEIGGRLTSVRVCAVVASVAATMAVLPVEAAAIGNGWADAIEPATLRAILFDTTVGTAWWAEAGAALVLLATLVLPPPIRPAATAISSGLLLATFAMAGHAAARAGGPGLLLRLNNVVHVLAAGAWLGSLVSLVPVLRSLDDSTRRADATIALRRFSTAGHAAVALVIGTGVANAALILRRWPVDWSSPYQAMLSIKVALVAAMVLLALANRYVVVPRMRRSHAGSCRMLQRATGVEIGLGVAVIGCVAVFGLLDPI